MKKLLKALGAGLLKLATSAARNAIASPKTTLGGVAAISTGVGALTSGPLTVGNVGGAVVAIIGGVGLVLADDPKKVENDQKSANN